MKVNKPGFIYCFSHPMLTLALGENVFKLGRTIKIKSRAKSATTFMAIEMECLHQEEVIHDVDAEDLLFEMLAEFRVRPDREFFKIELPYIKRVMASVKEEINSQEYHNKTTKPKNKVKPVNKIHNKGVRYCLRCGKIYPKKSHWLGHLRRKKPCTLKYLDISGKNIVANYYDLLEEFFELVEDRKKIHRCDKCDFKSSYKGSYTRHIKDKVCIPLEIQVKLLKKLLDRHQINY